MYVICVHIHIRIKAYIFCLQMYYLLIIYFDLSNLSRSPEHSEMKPLVIVKKR